MVTLGLAPLAGQVVPALRMARSAGSVLFDFEGLRAFKARLRPARWRQISLVYPPGQGALVTVVVLAWNVPRHRGPADGVASLVAVAAPALAFVILWRARVRRRAPL